MAFVPIAYSQTEWSTPQRLDGEYKFKSARSPSISSDDSTLYIESRGHVYYSTITDTGWTWPERLDAPFNHPDVLIHSVICLEIYPYFKFASVQWLRPFYVAEISYAPTGRDENLQQILSVDSKYG